MIIRRGGREEGERRRLLKALALLSKSFLGVPNKPAIGQLTLATSATAAVRKSKHSSGGKN